MFSGYPQGINSSKHIHVDSKIWIPLSQCRKNSSEVNDVRNLVILDDLLVAFSIENIHALVLTWEVELLFSHIGSNDVFCSDLFDKRINEGNTKLTLTPSDKHARFFEISDSLLRCSSAEKSLHKSVLINHLTIEDLKFA